AAIRIDEHGESGGGDPLWRPRPHACADVRSGGTNAVRRSAFPCGDACERGCPPGRVLLGDDPSGHGRVIQDYATRATGAGSVVGRSGRTHTIPSEKPAEPIPN